MRKGTTAYHTVYHEYTHALLHLNFSRIPLWLSEGVAEFFGNSTVGPQEARTGNVDKTHLYILSKNEWMPIETLLEVKRELAVLQRKESGVDFLRGIVGGGALPAARSGGPARTTAEEIPA